MAMEHNFAGLGFRSGDVIVITSAASGIGRATAVLAARSGLTVVGWDFDEPRLTDAMSEITTAGGSSQGVVCDVADDEQVAAAWESTARIGPPAYLVNNAGPPSSSPLTVAEGLIQGAGSVATVTEAWLARHAATAEAVTFTASIAGNYTATPSGSTWYPVAKAAIAAYARQIAVAYGGCPRANVVAPGLTSTPRTQTLIVSEIGQNLAAKIPMGRLGRAEDQAAAHLSLLSPAASYVNGVTLTVDGASIWVGA